MRSTNQSFLDFLVKKEDIHPDQVESLQFYLDLELRDLLVKTNMISIGRIAYRWSQFYKDAIKTSFDVESVTPRQT